MYAKAATGLCKPFLALATMAKNFAKMLEEWKLGSLLGRSEDDTGGIPDYLQASLGSITDMRIFRRKTFNGSLCKDTRIEINGAFTAQDIKWPPSMFCMGEGSSNLDNRKVPTYISDKGSGGRFKIWDGRS